MTVSPLEAPTRSVPRLWLETASSAMPEIARDMVNRIRAEVPSYRDDPHGRIGVETRRAVREALTMFMKSVVWGMPPDEHGVEIFRRLGRIEAEAGRSHDILQSAYRVASQSAMHSLLRWEREHNASSDAVAALSSKMFAFIDELARYSAEGYAAARDADAEQRRARSDLVALLIHRDGFVRRSVTEAAERLDWTLPATVTIVETVTEADLELAVGLLPERTLAATVSERYLAVVPGTVDVDELRARAREVDGDPLLVVGPSVPVVEAASAARLCQRLRLRHDVRERAVDGIAVCDECMIGLILDAGRDATRALASSRLMPLAALSPGKRLKYGRLLSAWLEYGTLSADEPGVLDKHRQTLRYQVGQLEKMFGDALTNRDARLEIMLALRAALPLWERQAESTASRRG